MFIQFECRPTRRFLFKVEESLLPRPCYSNELSDANGGKSQSATLRVANHALWSLFRRAVMWIENEWLEWKANDGRSTPLELWDYPSVFKHLSMACFLLFVNDLLIGSLCGYWHCRLLIVVRIVESLFFIMLWANTAQENIVPGSRRQPSRKKDAKGVQGWGYIFMDEKPRKATTTDQQRHATDWDVSRRMEAEMDK